MLRIIRALKGYSLSIALTFLFVSSLGMAKLSAQGCETSVKSFSDFDFYWMAVPISGSGNTQGRILFFLSPDTKEGNLSDFMGIKASFEFPAALEEDAQMEYVFDGWLETPANFDYSLSLNSAQDELLVDVEQNACVAESGSGLLFYVDIDNDGVALNWSAINQLSSGGVVMTDVVFKRSHAISEEGGLKIATLMNGEVIKVFSPNEAIESVSLFALNGQLVDQAGRKSTQESAFLHTGAKADGIFLVIAKLESGLVIRQKVAIN